MKLTEQEAKQYCDLMWALQHFVNQKLSIIPDINNVDEYAELDYKERFQVRNALYENKDFINLFVKENPQNFSEEELSIISGWNNFIEGEFYIERFLKKYAIFIKEETVYGVIGLNDSLSDMIHSSQLPLYSNMVLLPFKGKIIYDGILQPYRIHFGAGYKSDLKEIYMIAKQNNCIIETLEPRQGKKQEKDIAPQIKIFENELNTMSDIAKKLRGGSGSPAVNSPAFSLLRACVEFAQLVDLNPEDEEILEESLKKVNRAFKKTETVLYRQIYA